MPKAQINLQRKQSLNKIILSCEELSKERIFLPKLTLSYTSNQEHAFAQEEKALINDFHPKMYRCKLLHSINLNYTPKMPSLDRKQRAKTEAIEQHANLSPQNRSAFRRIVEKYKRNFHPSNASRGCSNTSEEEPVKTPRKIRELRARNEDKQSEIEIRRMSILSQVINQNNRRERRVRRDKSRTKNREIEVMLT